MKTPLVPQELPLTMPAVPDASSILGIGRSTAYLMLQEGMFPVRVLKVGKRYRVSRADLLEYLGETKNLAGRE